MNAPHHPLLARQLRRLLDGPEPIAPNSLAERLRIFLVEQQAPRDLLAFAERLPDFFERIDQAYSQFDRDLALRSRSLQQTSAEFLQLTDQLRASLLERDDAISRLEALIAGACEEVVAGVRRAPDHTPPRGDPANRLADLVSHVAGLVDRQRAAQAAMRDLHTSLANQKFALDQHAIVCIARPDGTISYANDRLCEISGYGRDELLGTEQRLLLDDPQAMSLVSEIRQAIAAGRVWRGELRNRRKDGTPFWVAATLVPLKDAEDRLEQVISIYTDITERRRIEDEVRLARDAAEAASKAKTEFLSCMSHELRTPMNAILGYSQLLRADAQEAEQSDSLDEIIHAGKHLLELINEVLDLSRIESGRLDLAIEPIDLAALIDDCVSLIQPAATQRGILVACAASDGSLGLDADRTRLRQVLLNLLSNAVKYNRHQGKVDIRYELLGGRLRISVADTGFGIADDLLARLFRPFERHSSGAHGASVEGTGIGLALSKQLVEAMGGLIGVSSRVGAGSTFWVELPGYRRQRSATADALEPPPPSAAMPPRRPARTILYIEDNAANVRLMQKIAAAMPGTRLLDAPRAEAGLAIAREQHPHLILMDINLPGIDGYVALARLRANPATRDIPVVAVSANAMQSDIDRALAAGFDAYVTKPIDVAHLLATIQSMNTQREDPQ